MDTKDFMIFYDKDIYIYTKMKLLKPLCWTRQVRVPHLSPAALQSTNSADTFAFKRGMIAAVGPSFNRCFESQDFPFWKGRFCSELSHPKLPGPCVASRENTQSDFSLHEWLADPSSNPPQLSLCETTPLMICVFLPEKTAWVCASRWAELCKSCKQKCLMWLWNMSPRFDALAASFLLEVSQVPEAWLIACNLLHPASWILVNFAWSLSTMSIELVWSSSQKGMWTHLPPSLPHHEAFQLSKRAAFAKHKSWKCWSSAWGVHF